VARDDATVEAANPPVPSDASDPTAAPAPRRRRIVIVPRVRELIRAINDGDEAKVETAILDLSRRKRWLAPLAFAVGAFVMLFQGVRLLLSNWRLTLVELLPAVWIWLATYDLKLHFLRGHTFREFRGPILIPIFVVIVGLTAASLYLNAVFGFAVSQPGRPEVRPAFARARTHAAVILTPGVVVGLGLAVSSIIFPRWGRWWFAISLSIVLAVMTYAYVAIPARLMGVKPVRSRRDKLSAGVISGTITALVCGPPHLLNRLAILMLGFRWLFIPGIILLTFGVTLQAGATGAVKALKMSTKLFVGHEHPGKAAGQTAQDVSTGTS
jgi:hypothetical protein